MVVYLGNKRAGDGTLDSSLNNFLKGEGGIAIPYGVTEIKEGMFSDMPNLTSVTIPNSVTKLSFSAFSGCTSLKSITIPNSVTDIIINAFEECPNLKEIKIDKARGSIDGSPWGAENARVIWLR